MKPEVKMRLIERLIHTEDDEILDQIQEILESKNNHILGSRPDGTPVTKKDVLGRVEKAKEDVKNGRFISHSEVVSYFQKKIAR